MEHYIIDNTYIDTGINIHVPCHCIEGMHLCHHIIPTVATPGEQVVHKRREYTDYMPIGDLEMEVARERGY